jgi:hypothetical protein
MDARPLFKRYEIPLLNISAFPADHLLRDELLKASQLFLDSDFESVVEASARRKFGIRVPKVVQGNIGSGDKFFANKGEITDLWKELQSLRFVTSTQCQWVSSERFPILPTRWRRRIFYNF